MSNKQLLWILLAVVILVNWNQIVGTVQGFVS